MKKLIALVMGMLLVPTMAMGMQSMSDKSMNDVTGQAGVSIAVDDVKMYQNIQGLWYTDTDGINTASAVDYHTAYGDEMSNPNGQAASIGIDELSVMVDINAITNIGSASNVANLESTGRALQGTYDSSLSYSNTPTGAAQDFLAKPLNIDVTNQLPVLSTAATENANDGSDHSVAGVQIGLGTMEIVQSALQFDVAMKDGTPLEASSNMQSANMENPNAVPGGSEVPSFSFGQITIEKTTMAILDGNVEIAPH